MTDSRSPLLSQAVSISKAINTQEAPVKEKHARRILSLGSLGGCGGDPGGLLPRRAGAAGGLGGGRLPQSSAGGWNHVGLSSGENADEWCNKLAFVWL